MAAAVRSRGKSKSTSKASASKPKTRARRVAVAKAKSSPKAKAAAAKAAADAPRRRAPVAPVAAVAPKARAKAIKAATAAPVPPSPRSSRKATGSSPVAAPGGTAETLPADAQAAGALTLTDEEQIESAKYSPRRSAARVFEEERFLFPQTYGVNRLRLLVKDPQWLFAYWDVDPRALETLRADLGERASALAQLTLRVFEDRNGGASTFLLPQDARTWYVPTRSAGRAYRAEVGVMLPSGEFRSLARSNSVVAPRGERSSQKARRRVRYDRALPLAPGAALGRSGDDLSSADQPWEPPLDAGAGPEEERPRATPKGRKTVERGGASDLHRR
jgi:hypothetical protein